MRSDSNSIDDAFGVVIGLDVGDKFIHVCVLDKLSGEVVEDGRLTTSQPALARRFERALRARIILEVGPHSRWISALLEEFGHEVFVANPRTIRLITHSNKKTDRADAETLARLGRADLKLLSQVRHRSRETQGALAVLRGRDGLVNARTALVNQVRGVLKSFGIKPKKCSTETFPRYAREILPSDLRSALTPLLDVAESLTEKIGAFDEVVDSLAEETYPETQLLTQIKGVGNLTALAFFLTIEDPHRFSSSRSVGTYLGLTPRCRDSGESSPQLRITKAGDTFVRRLLVQAAHYIIGPFGPDCDLRRWGLKLVDQGGKAPKKRAAVAIARKLAVLLHRLWVTGEVYDPLLRPNENMTYQTEPLKPGRKKPSKTVEAKDEPAASTEAPASAAKRSTSKASTAKRSTSKASAAKRSTSKASAAKRSTSKTSAAKRSTSKVVASAKSRATGHVLVSAEVER